MRNFELLVKARKALDSLWKNEAWLKGRCWGSKKEKNNPYRCSNITIAIADELVSVSEPEEGQLVIHEFKRVAGTQLGDRIREVLKKEKLI